MKLIPTSILGAMMIAMGSADAAPWWSRQREPQRHTHRDHGHGHRHDRTHQRIEVKAQIRLKQLGYYRGTIDGQFGRGSRTALVRFQRDHRLPMTGRLDARTIRALRI